MTETILAILSPDNVLRLVSSNGKGIEEKAAIALSHEYPLPSLVDLVETLIRITEPSEPKPETKKAPATKRKAKVEPKAKDKPKRARAKPHSWLKSSTLIRFINENPGREVPFICQHLCIALGKQYINSSEGNGDVCRSRIGNLVSSGKLRRHDGRYWATKEGLAWADATDPVYPSPVPEGQELLAE